MQLTWLGLVFFCCKLFPLVKSGVFSTNGILYRRYKRINMQSPCVFFAENVRSLLDCVVLCENHSACKTLSYHTSRKTCCVGGDFNENAVYVQDDNSWFLLEMQDHVWYNGWAMAFRAVAGNGKSIYSAWTKFGHHDDAPVGSSRLSWGCLTLNSSWDCDGHFRSTCLDTWDSLGVQKVSLRLYKNGVKVADVIFNGTGSDVTSWMSPSRILQSSWDDLSTSASSYNYFGINEVPVHQRYFFISKIYGGCNKDQGWLCAIDPPVGRDLCGWERLSHPAFVYSAGNTAVKWESSGIGVADVLVVFIQF